MTRKARTSILLSATAAAITLSFSLNASAAVDVDAAKALARENNCFKCHGVDKEKDGPSYKKVAEKYRGKPGAEERLVTHVTSGKKQSFPMAMRKNTRSSRPKTWPQIKNLVNWILSL